jgi:hypothetical protein
MPARTKKPIVQTITPTMMAVVLLLARALIACVFP